MNDKEAYDKYAADLARRFDEFTQWAIQNWPNQHFRLMQSDFEQSRKELGQILGAKLGEAEENASPTTDDKASGYVDMNPAPWP